MMLPTARAARGLPASFATAPYVVTRPTGTRRTIERTRRAKRVSAFARGPETELRRDKLPANADFEPQAPAAEIVLGEMRGHTAFAERLANRRICDFARDRQP